MTNFVKMDDSADRRLIYYALTESHCEYSKCEFDASSGIVVRAYLYDWQDYMFAFCNESGRFLDVDYLYTKLGGR